MKKTSNSNHDVLSAVLLVIAIFMSFGWYFAEADNELLLQELEAQNYGKTVHLPKHEELNHD